MRFLYIELTIVFLCYSITNAFSYSIGSEYDLRAPNIDCSEEDKHHPHDLYCDLYYACEDDKPVPKKCPSGLHFSAALRVCVLPEFADCQVSGFYQTTKFTTFDCVISSE